MTDFFEANGATDDTDTMDEAQETQEETQDEQPQEEPAQEEPAEPSPSDKSKILYLSDIRERLSAPIPSRFISQKKKGGATLDFCSWYNVQRLLDHHTNGHWEKEIVSVEQIGKEVMVHMRITIIGRAGDGTVVRRSREATGREEVGVSTFGDSTSNAESMAFRRACAAHGLGLHLWIG